jgi:hypothetical protein
LIPALIFKTVHGFIGSGFTVKTTLNPEPVNAFNIEHHYPPPGGIDINSIFSGHINKQVFIESAR